MEKDHNEASYAREIKKGSFSELCFSFLSLTHKTVREKE